MEEIVRFKKKRFGCMFATMVACICIGFIYAWSVIQTPIILDFGWEESRVALAYTAINLCSNFGAMIFGSLIRKMSTRQCIMTGAVLFGGGILITGMITQLWQLYLFFGVCAGFGSGFIYPQMMAYAVKIFPERSGMASGLATAAFGSGAVIWAPITTVLLENKGFQGTMMILGLLFLIVIFAVSLLLIQPPKAFLEEHVANKSEAIESDQKQYNRSQMVRTSQFYMLLITYVCALVAGMMIISQASPMLQQMLEITPTKAAFLVSIFSATNVVGRFFWGSVSDILGLYQTITVIFVIDVAAILLLSFVPLQMIFYLALSLATSC